MNDATNQRIAAAAHWLDAEHAQRRTFVPLGGDAVPASVAQAYEVQDALVALRCAAGRGPRVGHKIALTTPTMRAFVGYGDSIAGQVLASDVQRSPATISAGAGVHIGFECELAFLVGSDTRTDAPPSTRAEIAALIGGVCAAFELIDDRGADYSRFGKDAGATMLSLAADNAWNHGVVLGHWNTDWQGLDLEAVRGVATVNGVETGVGHGRDVLGHPLDAMLWIVRHLQNRGQGLRAGEFVTTGSLVATRFPQVGERVLFAVDGVGEVRMDISA